MIDGRLSPMVVGVTMMLLPSVVMGAAAIYSLAARDVVPLWSRVTLVISSRIVVPTVVLWIVMNTLLGSTPDGFALIGAVTLIEAGITGVLACMPRAFSVELNPELLDGHSESYVQTTRTITLAGWALLLIAIGVYFMIGARSGI